MVVGTVLSYISIVFQSSELYYNLSELILVWYHPRMIFKVLHWNRDQRAWKPLCACFIFVCITTESILCQDTETTVGPHFYCIYSFKSYRTLVLQKHKYPGYNAWGPKLQVCQVFFLLSLDIFNKYIICWNFFP